jgi:hypothetical protein
MIIKLDNNKKELKNEMSEENKNKSKLVSDRLNTFFTNNKIIMGSGIPTEGTFNKGDIIVNEGPTSVEEPMWICNEGGTPGKWGLVGTTSTSIVRSYSAMMKTRAMVGNLFYVMNDELWEGEPGFYIVLSVKVDEDGNKVPDEVERINKKENNVPVLSYDPSMPEGTKMYLDDNEDLILKFNFTSNTYGDGKYRVYRDGVLMRAFSAAKGNVIVNLGPITMEGTFNITVTATDYLTIPAPETLSFTVIVGGLTLSSTFEETLTTAIFEEGDIIQFPYIATVSDLTATMKLNIQLLNSDNEVVQNELLTLSGAAVSGMWNSSPVTARGRYTLVAQAYTGASLEDETEGTFVSNQLKYEFRVLQENEIGISSSLQFNQIDDQTYLSIPFKVVSRIANYFVVRGKLEKETNGSWVEVKATSGNGILSTVNITNYWSVGKLEIGNYRFTLSAYTVDGGIKSLEDDVKELLVVESSYERVQPITANLIAWFDANDKRNNDEHPDIWFNNSKLGDTYRIILHDLNYNSNGWKHIDTSLADDEDGEMMLKMTGESYGELVKMNNGEIEGPYSPFSIFSNSGQPGITIETAFRTRCIGERNSRVMTCMDTTKFDSPGAAISFDTLAIGSDSQVNTAEFMEDEWIHCAFVIDNNIRTLKDIGQENIENLNQTSTIRIYINGVLCACNTYKTDKFLDASGRAFPLILNACLQETGEFGNFGECEIKFLRIYNSYLTSSEVLNNYVSHIYDQEEQIAMRDRNDVDIATLPTITFRRNLLSNNKNNFAILNSITDKKTSKKTCVDCIMEYNDGEGNITIFDNVDVYLQGTSSLQYPVKNYKIKCYNDAERTSKNKIVPPGKEDVWVGDYTYTLKCDYMEQSHMNNTPTAVFYDQVVNFLGGESPARKEDYRDSIDGFPCVVYYDDGDGVSVLAGSFMFNIDKAGAELGFECNLYDDDGNIIGNGKDSCVSYEGTANASDTAGCFYKLEESIQSVYRYYVEDEYKKYLEERGLDSTRFTMEQFQAGIQDGSIDAMTFDEFVADYDEIDFVMADFEARYSFNEDDDHATYKPMLDLINWVSDSIKAGTFKKDFEAHFDLTYMLAYYLQMQMFAQVDNCGKNCMWDTWDGVKFYPRPYDMDTEMGLSNTGTETIRVDAEILPELSPVEATGTHAGYEITDKTTDLRYLSFNTKTSKLWNAFAKEFANEIKTTYQSLRSAGIYSFKNITDNANGMTNKIIGEVYYNKDAGSKYLSQTTDQNSEYLKMLHGNRIQKFGKFLKERIIFLDTVYDYMESDIQADSLNSIITLRSDALYGQSATETLKCYLGISSYSPQYVTISVGSGMDAIVTGYVGPESTYKDPDTGIEREGALFSFPIRGTDKEMTISGAGNIKNVDRLQLLNVRDLIITKAEKIIELDLSYSSRMTALALGNNKYLRKLDCSNSYMLGTAVNGQLLDLTKCVNLKDLNISWTKINAVNFPKDTALNRVILNESSVKNVDIEGAEFLVEIGIENCVNISRFRLERCNKIETVDVSGSTIQSFLVTNCTNVRTLNVSECRSITDFDITNSYNVETLNMRGNASPFMKDLQLYSMYSLKNLIISQTTSANTVRLPKYLNEIEAAKASNGEEALPWNTLESLDLSDSSIVKLQYGSADASHNVCDMSQLTNLTSLKFNGCTEVVEIRDLDYKSPGSLNSLFYQCKKLTRITGTISGSSSISSLFAQCFVLSDIDSLTFNFKNVSNASSACDRCYRLKTPMLKKILTACGSSLTNIDNICHMSSLEGYTGILGTTQDTTREIPGNLFENNPNITSAVSAFDITGYQSVHGDLLNPCANKISNITTMFSRMPNLTTVGPNLLKNKPNLKTVLATFKSSNSLQYYIHEDPNIFEGSPNITTTREMFSRCYYLRTGSKGFGEMMYPLVNLTDCAHMFYDCYINLNAEIPNGFLSKNTKLTRINGLFGRCRVLPKLPRSLFRVKVSDTNTFPNLTKACGVFGECNALTGVVDSTFFAGAEKLLNISRDSEYNEYWSVDRYPYEGFFQNTLVSVYHESILNPLTSLQKVGGLFYSCNELTKCFYYDESGVEREYANTIGEKIFAKNTLLTDCSYMFYDCTNAVGCIPAHIFDPCRSTLSSVAYMFNTCTKLTAVDLDDTTGNSFRGIRSEWFKNSKQLVNVSYFLDGCTLFAGEIPEDFLEGCNRITDTRYMFYNCQSITGEIPLKLFDSCRETIQYTNYMFYNCIKLTEPIPTGEYETVQGITGYVLCRSDEEGALQVVQNMVDPFTQVSYGAVVELSPNLSTQINPAGGYYVKATVGDIINVKQLGLLSECLELRSVAGMFYYCKAIKGGIPHDIFFTRSISNKYTRLTDVSYLFGNCEAMNAPYTDPDTGIAYLCSHLLFDKCPAITNFNYTFTRLYAMPACQIHPNMFDKQAKVVNADSLFEGIRQLTGPISPLLLRNSITTLTHARRMFAFTNMTSVTAEFLNGGGLNSRLNYIRGIFYSCSNLAGTSPEFWNGSKFSAIQGTEQGYWGALYPCSKLSNYNAAKAVSANWTNSQPIYL